MSNINGNTTTPDDFEMPNIPMPKRIILVRHGESEGNKNKVIFKTIPDLKVSLTAKGVEDARQAGSKIKNVVSENGKCHDWKVYFYVSPYKRTKQTLEGILESFPKERILGVREECRIRERDFGNFQDPKQMKELNKKELEFGRFFFRYPQGESGADVYDRVSVEQYEGLWNPGNGEVRVMELGPTGEYSLYFHHHDEKILVGKWGLTPEMIEDQKQKAGKSDSNETNPFNLKSFFLMLKLTMWRNIEQKIYCR